MVGSSSADVVAAGTLGPEMAQLSGLPITLGEAVWSAARAACTRRDARFHENPLAPELAREAGDESGLGQLVALVAREGARRPEERAVVAGLVVLGAAKDFPSAPETELESARSLVWLETHTGLSLLGPLFEHLGNGATTLAVALETLLCRGPQELLPSEAFIASAALTRSPGALEGELGAPPRGPLATALLTVTLWTFATRIARHAARAVLGYRTHARARVTERGLELAIQKKLLGRTLRDDSLIVPFTELARLSRETRFAGASLYAGLASLALGTYLGAGFFVDALRAPGGAPSLFGVALLLVAAGIVADFALQTLSARSRSACRLVIIPKRGPGFALTGVEPARADAMLRQALSSSSVPSGLHPAQ